MQADASETVDRPPAQAGATEMRKVLKTAMDLHRAGHRAQAEQLYRVLLSVDPRHADALHLLGALANETGAPELAVQHISQAIAVNPRVPAFHFNLGVALQNLERHAEAVRAYETATALAPGFRQAFENLGVARRDCGDDDGALAAYRSAIAIDDGAPLAHRNLGTALLERGDVSAASRHLERALAATPADPGLLFKRAAVHLHEGRYGEGWDDYESRFCDPAFVQLNTPAHAPWPRWNGTPPEGRTLLITAEQGIGDDLLFASCYADVVARAGHCVIVTDARLIELYARSFPTATVYANAADLQGCAIDARISAGSLPRFLRRDADAFPRRSQYLWSDPQRRAHWRRWLDERDDTLKVGISWRGGLKPRAREARSAPLELWRDLLAVPGASFFSLQYGDHEAEVRAFERGGGRVCRPAGLDPLQDIDELAAFTTALDLVITIDNTTTHLAGALGVPTWALLPAFPDWRWRLAGGGNPWFPSVESVCQERAGDWSHAFERVTRRLRDRVGNAPVLGFAPAPARVEIRAAPHRTLALRKAVLLNDTTNWYHFGCTATSLAIHDRLRAQDCAVSAVPMREIADLRVVPDSDHTFDSDRTFDAFARAHPQLLESLDDADLVYVNGEGTLHRLGHQAMALLYLVHLASGRLGKPVRVINHSCYPEGDVDAPHGIATGLYRRVYEQLDYIAVREGVSAALLRGLGLKVTESFDCLPLYVDGLYRRAARSESPYAVIAGGVAWRPETTPALARLVTMLRKRGLEVRLLTGANAYPAGDEPAFIASVWRACGAELDLVVADSESRWLDEIGGAELLVSGRFHHSIAAAFLGTPFIVSQSNTPKINGLLDLLQLDALVGVPGTWSDAAARSYADALAARAEQLLDRPEEWRLQEAVRSRLIDLSLRNFDQPA